MLRLIGKMELVSVAAFQEKRFKLYGLCSNYFVDNLLLFSNHF